MDDWVDDGLYRSQFLEADDVDGLDIIFPGGNLIEDIVSVDLGIFNDASALELKDLSNNWDLLGLVVPDEAFKDDLLLYFLPKTVKIEFFFVDLNIEDDDGFSDNYFLGLGSWLSNFLLGLGGFLRLISSEKIDLLVFLFNGLLLLLFFLLLLFLFLLGLEGLVGVLGEIFRSNDSISGDQREIPGSGVGISFSLLFSEGGQDDGNTGSQAEISNGGTFSDQEFLSVEVALNESEEFVDISKNFDCINFSSVSGDSNSGNCSFEIACSDIEPLINLCPVVKVITSVESVSCSGGEESDDGVGGEESSLRGFQKGEGVEDGNS